MNGADRSKLINAGFRIFRGCKINKSITELNPSGAWKLVSRHTTVREFTQAVADLRLDQKNIFENDDL